MYTRLKKKIDYLGIRLKVKAYIIIRLISCVLLFVVLLLTSKYGYFIAPMVTVVYYYLVEYVTLDLQIKRRIAILEDNALLYFPVFLLVFSGDKNVKSAIIKSTNIVKNELTKEFVKAVELMDLGRSVDEGLSTLSSHIPSVFVNNIIVDIMEANRLGNNIQESINLQLDLIKAKRKREIISDLKLIPLKLTLLSIFFVLVVLVILSMFKFF
jgi:pilus assembly protein TadC